MSKFLSEPEHFAVEPDQADGVDLSPGPPPDDETLARAALDLREQYPDDDEFAAAMGRLAALLGGDAEPPAPDGG